MRVTKIFPNVISEDLSKSRPRSKTSRKKSTDNVNDHQQTAIANEVPLYNSRVQAGFPSPADDHMDLKLDLNKYLIKQPAATFLVRVAGDSMIEACIKENDLLVVDRSITATNNKIVIAVVEGEFTVKRLKLQGKKAYLIAENKNYSPMEIGEGSYIWGVVTALIHQF